MGPYSSHSRDDYNHTVCVCLIVCVCAFVCVYIHIVIYMCVRDDGPLS